jgi:hypothetical protein
VVDHTDAAVGIASVRNYFDSKSRLPDDEIRATLPMVVKRGVALFGSDCLRRGLRTRFCPGEHLLEAVVGDVVVPDLREDGVELLVGVVAVHAMVALNGEVYRMRLEELLRPLDEGELGTLDVHLDVRRYASELLAGILHADGRNFLVVLDVGIDDEIANTRGHGAVHKEGRCAGGSGERLTHGDDVGDAMVSNVLLEIGEVQVIGLKGVDFTGWTDHRGQKAGGCARVGSSVPDDVAWFGRVPVGVLFERVFFRNRREKEAHACPFVGVEGGLGKVQGLFAIDNRGLDGIEEEADALHHNGHEGDVASGQGESPVVVFQPDFCGFAEVDLVTETATAQG